MDWVLGICQGNEVLIGLGICFMNLHLCLSIEAYCSGG
jgi:hypothetical protein